ncbi:MAG: hypothetical protein LBU68_00945, partial [Rickettsiales bacterium]|nr:hypothetical protein [Rickettsiales bacterium]
MKNKITHSTHSQYKCDKIPAGFFPFLWHFVRPIKWGFFAWLFLTFIQQFLYGVVDPLFSKEFVHQIETFSGEKGELLSHILPLILLLIGIQIIRVPLGMLRIILRNKYSNSMKEKITADLTKYVHQNSLQYISNISSGRIYQKIADAGTIQNVLQDILWTIISTVILFVSNIIIIYNINEQILFIFITWVIIHMIWSIYRIKPIKKQEKISADIRSKFAGKIIDTFINFMNVKMFSFRGTEEKELDKYAIAQTKMRQVLSGLYMK